MPLWMQSASCHCRHRLDERGTEEVVMREIVFDTETTGLDPYQVTG